VKVVFENATIADVIGSAARVAPTKGSAYDKAAGILMTLDEENKRVEVRSTNLLISYLTLVDAVSVEGSGSWRFPTKIIHGLLSRLPIGSGKEVTLFDEKGVVKVKSGRTSASIRTGPEWVDYYPNWEPFDPEMLDTVEDLGPRIKQVEWAAGGDPPMAGIHLNGELIVATDRYRIATVPCVAEPIYKPITVPSGIFDPVIKSMRDVAVGIEEGQFLLMPDGVTQIRANIYADAYPPVERAFLRDHTQSVSFKKTDLIEMVDRAMVFAGNDRVPLLTMYLGKEEIAVMMTDQEQGLLGDIIDVPGQATHSRVKVLFTPQNLTDAIEAAPSESVEMFYEPGKHKSIRIDGGSGYEAWVMPRRAGDNQ